MGKNLVFEIIKQRLNKTERARDAIIRKCNKEINKLTKALEKACDHPADGIYFWAGEVGSVLEEDTYCCRKCNLTVTESMDKKMFRQMQRKYSRGGQHG